MNYFKSIYNNCNDKHPILGTYLFRLYIKKPFNSVKKKIRGKNNSISYKGSILSSVLFDIKGNNNNIKISPNCILDGTVFVIRGNNHIITIGSGTQFIDNNEIVFEDNDCMLDIGENNKFYGVHMAVTEPFSKIKIGNECSFAYDIDIRTGDSHSILTIDGSKRLNPAKDISIDNRVWVAAHTSILKGVELLENTIVATRSVVTNGFNDTNILIAGIPAKIKKRNITWSRQRV